MRDWVKSFLLEEIRNTINELAPNISDFEKEEWFNLSSQELNKEDGIFVELTRFFNTNIGGGIVGPGWVFTCAFGSVLADLPKDVFDALREMKNLFIAYCELGGAQVKWFDPEHDISVGERIIVVVFPESTGFYPLPALRGVIAHELAHVYARHVMPEKLNMGDKAEEEADALARSWGFEAGIDALREMEKERKEAFDRGELTVDD